MPIRQDEIDAIRNKVFELTCDEDSFTAFDVSKALRKTVDRPHRMIRPVIHEMFAKGDMGEYVREQINIPGANPPPWLYHLPENDPQDYLASKPLGKKSKTVSKPVAALQQSPVSSNCLKVSCDNRIYLPTKVAKDWGLTPGKTAFSLITRGKIIVRKKFHNALEAIQAVNAPVDAKGNIRINAEVTTRFQGKSFTYSRRGDEVVLEQEP